jgi:hypothetical protein
VPSTTTGPERNKIIIHPLNVMDPSKMTLFPSKENDDIDKDKTGRNKKLGCC